MALPDVARVQVHSPRRRTTSDPTTNDE